MKNVDTASHRKPTNEKLEEKMRSKGSGGERSNRLNELTDYSRNILARTAVACV